MANLTYNRTGKALRFDLSDADVVIVDAVVSARGLAAIERQMNEFFREYLRWKQEQDAAQIQEKLREKLSLLTDSQRQAILTILNA
jgi:hypothetical protein